MTFKELKGGLHLGQMQVTREPERVQRSVFLPVLSYLLLLRLYGPQATCRGEVSLFQMKQRFITDMLHEQGQRIEGKWRRKFNKLKLAA